MSTTRVSLYAVLLLAGLMAMPQRALAQDYEREKRWSEEIVPGLVVGDAVWLDGPGERRFLGLYTEAKSLRAGGEGLAILLVHGVGVHPDHGVIGALRTSLADAGYATLSIQMPVQKADAGIDDYYPVLFPNAGARIGVASRWLRAKGAARIVLVSHSMGSWMSNVYYEEMPDSPDSGDSREAPFAAWVCMGLTGGYGNTRNVRAPVLDVYGENDLPSVLRADWRRRLTIGSMAGSRQVRIAGADHHYAGREMKLTAVIDAFVRERVLK